MKDYERGVRDAIRWRMTHVEQMSADPGEPRTKNGDYRIQMVADRVRPGELLQGSAEHRDDMIAIVQDFAVRDLTGQPGNSR